MRAPTTLTFLPLLFACLATSTVAEEEGPVFAVHFSNGMISPSILEVPADKRFKIELYNDGSTPIEFESIPLRREKVLAPGASSFLVFRSLRAGDYAFFDDFHLDMPPARLIAK